MNAMNRREALLTAAAAAGGWLLRGTTGNAAETPYAQPLRLGIDNFAVRAMQWKAPQLIDYAAGLATDSLFITDLFAFENFEDAYLQGLRQQAAAKDVQLYVGTWSICPSSTSFKKDWGSAEEHLDLGIRVARQLGSPALRVILGSRADRLTEGGIDARIADTVRVLKACRTRAIDAGVKIAVENHAGDMHSLELVRLIEDAGPDFVGANIDSGNATWTLEDPLDNLKNLAPYALTTSLRDSALWESPRGITIQWTAMGDGTVDWRTYFQKFTELCPQVPVNIETISGFNHELAVKSDEYWKAWPQGKPDGYERFLNLARGGKPRPPHEHPPGVDRRLAEQQYQRDELERSLRYCRTLGLGRKS